MIDIDALIQLRYEKDLERHFHEKSGGYGQRFERECRALNRFINALDGAIELIERHSLMESVR